MDRRQVTANSEARSATQTTPTGSGADPTSSFTALATTNDLDSHATTTSADIISSANSQTPPFSSMASSVLATDTNGQSSTSATPKAANATSTDTSVSSSIKSSSGVPTGTVAGATIGAAIGGALIAALIVFFIMRTRSGKAQRGNPARMSSSDGIEKGNANVNTREVEIAHAATMVPAWRKELPQPAADDTIRMEVQTLFHQLELHVENFYTDLRPADSSFTPDTMEDIEEFDDKFLPMPILKLIRSTSKPTSVIKRALAQHIVSNISFSDMKQTSFLPAECTALMQIRRRNAASSSRPGNAFQDRSSRRELIRTGLPEALAQWRVLTAYLRSDTTTPSSLSTSQLTSGGDATTRSAAAHFAQAFMPWVNPGQSGAVVQNLEAIMKSASRTGLLIFGQPAEFSYTWNEDDKRQSGRRNPGRLVVTPALLKIRDERSRLINPASVIVPLGTAEL